MAKVKTEFTVSVITREDLENQGFDASGLDDDVMESIASDMDNAYREYGDYFLNLELACKKYGVKSKETEDN